VVALIAALLGVALYLVTQLSAGPVPRAGTNAPPTRGRSASATPSVSAVSPSPTQSRAGSLGEYSVSERWFTFTEQAGPALGERVLHVVVRFPDIQSAGTAGPPRQGPFPLIVFAPGYRQCSASYSVLLRQWASAGYVVAAVNFPRTNCNNASPDESDLVNQPADLAFVIRRLDGLSGQRQGSLAGLIRPGRVAVAGHSDGGDTVAAMAAMSCCRHPYVRAAIVLAGAEWPAFAGSWFSAPTAPMLFVQGTADNWNPQAASLQLYRADNRGRRYYLELFGADHFTPYEGDTAPEPIVAHVTIYFLDQYLAGQGSQVRAMRRAGRVPGISQLTSGGRLP
jgi:predicted dienelactone hydrolase